jgi:hypothetical protein
MPFYYRELKSFMPEFNTTADVLIERLRNVADGKTIVHLYDEIGRAAMDMISNVSFLITKKYILFLFKYF